MFRDAVDSDLENIAVLARNNELLVPPLDEAAFARMLHWLHTGAPKGPRLQIVFEDEGEILAHFGAVPFEMKVGAQRIMAAFAANIVIDKVARNKALFFPLQKSFAKLLAQLGYAFSYGVMTRPVALKAHLATGWKKVGDVMVFARPVSSGAIIGKLYPRLGLQGVIRALALPVQTVFDWFTLGGRHRVQIEEVPDFGTSLDPFLARWVETQQVTAVRSSEILNWRFVDFAERKYRIHVARTGTQVKGYMVTRKMPMHQFSTLALVDLIAMNDDAETASALLDHCATVARDENVDLIATAFPEHYCFRNLLKRKGFFRTAEKFTLVTKASGGTALPMNSDTFDQWFINWFDHDFV